MKVSDLPERLQRYIDVDLDGCWIWMGTLQGGGYGTTRSPFTGKSNCAHRVVYQLLVGPIGEGLQLDHLCRVRHCVNPDHLEPVTPWVNTMRGDTPARRNAARTHCQRGHELTPDNVRMKIGKHGRQRLCRECEKARMRDWRTRTSDAA